MATNLKSASPLSSGNSDPRSADPNTIEELLKSAERLGFSKSEIKALNANYAKAFPSIFQ